MSLLVAMLFCSLQRDPGSFEQAAAIILSEDYQIRIDENLATGRYSVNVSSETVNGAEVLFKSRVNVSKSDSGISIEDKHGFQMALKLDEEQVSELSQSHPLDGLDLHEKFEATVRAKIDGKDVDRTFLCSRSKD